MLASGVCHSDLHVVDGEWERPSPTVLGHEGAGVVESLGTDVQERSVDAPIESGGLQVGDLVSLAWTAPCGSCVACERGDGWLCLDPLALALVAGVATGCGDGTGSGADGGLACTEDFCLDPSPDEYGCQTVVHAGGLAAALSTAAGLLLVISTAVSHDLLKKTFMPHIQERQELLFARIAAAVAVVIAGIFGIYPPGFVAEVVAFAFGLAAASFFPVILLGIFSKRMNKEAAISGMIVGLVFTFSYIVYFKFISPGSNNAEHWWFGISPEGIGTLGMILNFAVSIIVCRFTPPPPADVQAMVENIRIPRRTT